jgi:hypothetical protein
MKKAALWLLLPVMGLAVLGLWAVYELDRSLDCDRNCTPKCARKHGCA